MNKLSVCLLLALAAEGMGMGLASHVLGTGNALLLLAASMILGMFIISALRKKLNPSRPEDLLRLLYLGLACALFAFPGLISDVLGYLLLLPGIGRPAQRVLQARMSGLQGRAFASDNFYARFFGFDNFSSARPHRRHGTSAGRHNIVDAEYTVADEDEALPRPEQEAPAGGRAEQNRK